MYQINLKNQLNTPIFVMLHNNLTKVEIAANDTFKIVVASADAVKYYQSLQNVDLLVTNLPIILDAIIKTAQVVEQATDSVINATNQIVDIAASVAENLGVDKTVVQNVEVTIENGLKQADVVVDTITNTVIDVANFTLTELKKAADSLNVVSKNLKKDELIEALLKVSSANEIDKIIKG